jgi:prevent-host-death family protein
MRKLRISVAKANLEWLLTRVARGEEIELTRHGRTVARLIPPEPNEKRIDVEALRALTESSLWQPVSAGEFMRKMRDDERY